MKRVLLVCALAVVLVLALSVPALAGSRGAGMTVTHQRGALGQASATISGASSDVTVYEGGVYSDLYVGAQEYYFQAADLSNQVTLNGAALDVPVDVISYSPSGASTGRLVLTFTGVGPVSTDTQHDTWVQDNPANPPFSLYHRVDRVKYAAAAWELICPALGLDYTFQVSAADKAATLDTSVVQAVLSGSSD